MPTDVSVLQLASSMARHAGASHAATGYNIARADISGARPHRVMPFAEYLKNAEPSALSGRADTKSTITLDQEMVALTKSAGRHDAAVTIWSKALDLLRLAAQSPR